MDELAYALGGRASEEIIFGKISTGALNDLEKVTKQAYAMVSFFGMSEKIGNISFYDSSGQSDFGFTKPYSEKTAELIDAEVNQIIAESYERARQVLRSNIKGLTELAELLLDKEVIFSEDLERIFGKRRADILREEREADEKSKLPIDGNPEKSANKNAEIPLLNVEKTNSEPGTESGTDKKAPKKTKEKKESK